MRDGVVEAVPLRREQTDVRDLLRSSLEAVRRQAQAFEVAVTEAIDNETPAAALIDRGKIAWVIAALVGNALRYVRHGSQTLPGGTIAVRVAYDAPAREIVIDVQDDGPGIPAGRLQLLFSDAGGLRGVALGLAIARDVVTAHGGTFDIHSDTGPFMSGTNVRFTLPVV